MCVFDIEADGLRPTKIHVLSYHTEEGVKSITDYDEIREWLLAQKVLIGHNIIRYDIVHLERLLGVEIRARLVDTLILSWYLFPDRIRHGLEWWGIDFGVPKPKVTDWDNQPIEVYIKRCEEDVKINQKLWVKCCDYLSILYECHPDKADELPIVKYLTFKMDCAKEQERSKWKVDADLARRTLVTLYEERDEKFGVLTKAMPKVPVYSKRTRPAKPYKKDGSLSSTGEKWFDLLKLEGLPEDFDGEIKLLTGSKEPNPGSSPQIKDWLFSLGWEPITLKYEKDDDGQFRTIPQIRNADKELCESVLELMEKDPAIEALDGITVATHRIGILEGFLENMDEDGFVLAEIQGLTNTMRFKHTTVVNLPGVAKPYGKEVRGSLIAREGHELCGSDMASLEDNTKRHYMFPYDPEYVKEMSQADYDPHLSLAVFAGHVTKEEYADYQLAEKLKEAKQAIDDAVAKVVKKLKPIRKKFKVTNYSAVYGVGKAKLAREMKTSESEAKGLLEDYWAKNWSVRKVAEDCRVRTVHGQMWLFNPVSQFWYTLRADKDRFSTLNQGTGVYCFDSWIKEIRKVRPQLTAQFHDEIVLEVKKGSRDKCTKLLRDSLQKVNDKLKLNVTLGIDVQFGDNYGEIH